MGIKVYPFWGGGASGGLAAVAVSGDYSDLKNTPTLGTAAARNVGATAGTVAAGDDERLSDARTPTAHQHPASEIAETTTAKVMTGAERARLALALVSDVTGIAGADAVTNIVSLTQAEYDAIPAPNASTLYVITD